MQLENIKLESERLLLKPVSMEYAEDIFREFSEPVTYYMFPRPAKEISETIEFINASGEKRKAQTDLELVILNKQDNAFIGCIGAHRLQSDAPEFGIWVKQSAQGRGYGKESIGLLKDWAAENLSVDYIKYPVAEENIASRRIPEALGAAIGAQYAKTMLTGRTWNIVEYHIPLRG